MKTFKQFLSENTAFSIHDIEKVWVDINTKLFDNKLKRPKFRLEEDLNYLVKQEFHQPNAHILGFCNQINSRIVLMFSEKIRNTRELIEVIAHEMVHQALAEEHGYEEMVEIDHGPKFMDYAPLILKYHGIKLSQTLGDD